MKKMIAVLTVLLCVATTSPAFAGGYGHGGYHGGGHHHDGLGIAFGVAGGLLLGSALLYAAEPPPRTVVYEYPYTTYPPAVVVQPPRICLEDQTVSGEWQVNRYNGRQVWVQFPYPVTRRVQVPCY